MYVCNENEKNDDKSESVIYIYMGNTIIIKGDRIRSGQSTIACEGMNKS